MGAAWQTHKYDADQARHDALERLDSGVHNLRAAEVAEFTADAKAWAQMPPPRESGSFPNGIDEETRKAREKAQRALNVSIDLAPYDEPLDDCVDKLRNAVAATVFADYYRAAARANTDASKYDQAAGDRIQFLFNGGDAQKTGICPAPN